MIAVVAPTPMNKTRRTITMTADQLTAVLAERVMHWRVGPDRFLTGRRRWIPRWRFNPTEKLVDAFDLLEAADPEEYSMGANRTGAFWVRVRLRGGKGEARNTSKARAIAHAVARAIGINPEANG